MSSQYELIGGEAQKANVIAKYAEQGLCNSRVSVRPSVRPSVRLSVPSIDSSSGVRLVCR